MVKHTMKKNTVKKFTFSIFASLIFNNLTFAQPIDVQNFVNQQGWTETIFKQRLSNPVPGIVPLAYFTKDGMGPNCALIVETNKGPKILNVSSVEQGESYPQCLGFNGAEQFQMNNRNFVVFEFLTRETREDTFSRFYFVSKQKDGYYASSDELNNSASAPLAKQVKATDTYLTRARNGVLLARTLITEAGMIGMKLQSRDYLIDGSRSFSIFQDKSKTVCTFVVDDGLKLFSYPHTQFARGDSCHVILASGKLENKGKTFYIVMFEGKDGVHLGVVSVSANGVVEPNESAAVTASRSSKLSTMTQAKSALTAALK